MASSEDVQSRIIIDKNEDGSRLDRVLVRRLGTERRSLIMRLIRKGNVRVNGKRQKPESRVTEGDEIFLPNSLRGEAESRPVDEIPASLLKKVESLEILYEDQWLLAVHKPAGMVVHGGSSHGAGLIEALKEVRKLPDLRLAHRLDRDTSGVLLMAKNLEALRKLTESFRERDMQKSYFAWVEGHPYPYAGRMKSKLSKGITVSGERMVVDDEEGKESVTDYQVVLEAERNGFDYALVALNPHSGRTHQLRVQLQTEGHAILGDPKYAEKEAIQRFKKIGGRGLALHAWRLRFDHPVKQEPIELRASLPESWNQLTHK
ncbi:RluA family pseudouridine synthase [Pseudomonadota bacterium]